MRKIQERDALLKKKEETEAAIGRLKEEMKEQAALLAGLAARREELTGQLKELLAGEENGSREADGAEEEVSSDIMLAAQQVKVRLEQETERLAEEIRIRNQRLLEAERLEQEMKSGEEKLEEQKEEWQESVNNSARLDAELEALEKQIADLEKALDENLSREDLREDLQNRKEESVGKKERLEKELDEASAAWQEISLKKNRQEAAIEALRLQIQEEGREEPDQEAILGEKTAYQQQKESLASKRDELYAACRTNGDIRRRVQGSQEKQIQVEKEYIRVKTLSDTANGTLAGKRKIELETFVQMSYFDRILRRANLRLLTMSNGQYELKRQLDGEGRREKAGLELNVIDHYNGTERWKNDHYYLIGFSLKHQKIAHFRVDRLTSIENLETCFMPIEGFDVASYTNKMVDMFTSESSKEVTLLCENELMRVIIDHYGEDAAVDRYDDTHFTAKIEVNPSGTFYGWIFKFKGKIKILSPKECITEMQQIAQEFI